MAGDKTPDTPRGNADRVKGRGGNWPGAIATDSSSGIALTPSMNSPSGDKRFHAAQKRELITNFMRNMPVT